MYLLQSFIWIIHFFKKSSLQMTNIVQKHSTLLQSLSSSDPGISALKTPLLMCTCHAHSMAQVLKAAISYHGNPVYCSVVQTAQVKSILSSLISEFLIVRSSSEWLSSRWKRQKDFLHLFICSDELLLTGSYRKYWHTRICRNQRGKQICRQRQS